MEDEIARLRRLLKEEQHRREAAEELARESLGQTLQQYLEACHSLQLDIRVVTDPTLTTQGPPTDPVGRISPQRIIPWGEDFARGQEEIWDKLGRGDSFSPCNTFPSHHQMEYVRSCLGKISSEQDLRHFERDVVENAAQKLVHEANNDPSLRHLLDLQGTALGTVAFESHLGMENNTVSDAMEHLTIGGDNTEGAMAAVATPKPKPRRRARGKGNRADQFCLRNAAPGSQGVPVLAIEYKAPHKLSVDELATGLESEIQPQQDIINRNGNDFAFAARSLAAAIITQLFSYMIGKGIRYGYVCTGETFVFLHIPDDPTMVYFSLCVPQLDVLDNDETRLHRTAVAQVFAFILRALRARPPPMSWQDQTESLSTWAVEYDDVLSKIPETVRKELRPSAYRAQRWKGFTRSPIRTRARCQPPDNDIQQWDDDEDNGDSGEGSPSPYPKQSRRSNKSSTSTWAGASSSSKLGGNCQQDRDRQQAISSRPFCSQKCVLGLAYGGPVDKECANFHLHGSKHIDQLQFQRLIHDQLGRDRGPDADCMPLYLSGSVGALFKVCLSSHGYTLVAKGMERFDLPRLQHESEVYSRLRSLQGKHVPVCLGIVDLVLPYYYDCGVFTHFMFLGWAGRPLFQSLDEANKANVVDTITAAYRALHQLGVLHCDAALRNILQDPRSGDPVIVDFERAKIYNRQPLGSISANGLNRKRKKHVRSKSQPQLNSQSDDFARELNSIVVTVSRFRGK